MGREAFGDVDGRLSGCARAPRCIRGLGAGVVLALVCSASCTAPVVAEGRERDRAAVFASVNEAAQFLGKPVDQQFELEDGHRLLLWNYELLFSELEPGRFSYVAIVWDGRVVGLEKLFSGASVPASDGGRVTIDEHDMNVLTAESAPTSQKRAVLRRLRFAAVLNEPPGTQK